MDQEQVVDRETPSVEWVLEYERLRKVLQSLWSAPVKDMPAIAAVMKELDDAHAAFKAQHKTDDHQRY